MKPYVMFFGSALAVGLSLAGLVIMGFESCRATPLERHAEEMLGPCAKWPREEPCPTDEVIPPTPLGDAIRANETLFFAPAQPQPDTGRGDFSIAAGAGNRRCRFPGMSLPNGFVDWDAIVPANAGHDTCCRLVVVPCGEGK